RHHLVARDAREDRMHDRPLRSGFLPAPLGFRLGEFYHFGNAQITVELAIHDKNPAPNNVSGFGDPFQRPSAQAKIHRRLTLTHRAFVTSDEVRGRSSAGDEENPDIIVHAGPLEMLSPPQIMEGVLGRKSKLAPCSIGYEPIQPGAF